MATIAKTSRRGVISEPIGALMEPLVATDLPAVGPLNPASSAVRPARAVCGAAARGPASGALPHLGAPTPTSTRRHRGSCVKITAGHPSHTATERALADLGGKTINVGSNRRINLNSIRHSQTKHYRPSKSRRTPPGAELLSACRFGTHTSRLLHRALVRHTASDLAGHDPDQFVGLVWCGFVA